MRQAYRILPVYTGDISGAASALFELGSMTVIHDPSGCNSTYNTHDELRWYDRDSLIFITGLRDVDAIMGNDDKLIHDVLQAAEEFRPAFISLTNSPVPWMNGTDFEGIASVIEEQTGIPVFYVPSNGMHDYVRGAGLAFERLADRLVTDPGVKQKRPVMCRGRINVLGVTPLDFTLQTYVDDLSARLTNAGWEINSLWAMGESLDRIKNAANADLNLVVSSSGMKAAALLNRQFGIPWTAGCPVDGFEEKLFEEMDRTMADRVNRVAYLPAEMDPESRENLRAAGERLTLIGEPVTMGSLGAAIREKYGIETRIVCPTEDCQGLTGPGDVITRGEEEVLQALRDDKLVLADPMYEYVCPADCRLIRLSHLAFSGRTYRKEFRNLLTASHIGSANV
jgi:nitrogenase molybdenum-iron protein alpha/beta subunit